MVKKQVAEKQEIEITPMPVKTNVPQASRLKLAEFGRNVYQYIAPEGSNVEDYLDRDFWASFSMKFNTRDRIEIVEEFGDWFAEIFIRSLDVNGVDVVLLRKHEIGGVGPTGGNRGLVDGLHSEWRGEHFRWAAMDGDQVLRENFVSQSEADKWLRSHAEVISHKPAAA